MPALIEYQRSGGIAGQTVRLVVEDNGTARLYRRSDTTKLAVNPDTLERLKAMVERLDFDKLRADYRSPKGGADLYQYDIAHHGQRISVQDGAVPPELQPLIDVLNGLVRSRR
jgi:hypothetical protein